MSMVWPWSPKRHAALQQRIEQERSALRRDHVQLAEVKARKSVIHSMVDHLPKRREENGIAESLEELYKRRRS